LKTGPGGASPPAHWSDTGFSSFHSGGCHFAFADGHVQFLSEEIAIDVLHALVTRAGNEITSGENQ
jgi:prepilin-type processing-associated H-X9-DG protein